MISPVGLTAPGSHDGEDWGGVEAGVLVLGVGHGGVIVVIVGRDRVIVDSIVDVGLIGVIIHVVVVRGVSIHEFLSWG